MAFCSNCGNEIPEGTKFCPNCGTQVGTPGVIPASDNNVNNNQANIPQQTTFVPPQSAPEESKSGLDKFDKFFGIVLFILAIVDYNSDPPIVTILLSALIIAGAVFCLGKKYKLKGFTIIALIMAAFCLFAGVGQAKKYGMFTIPQEYEHVSKSTQKEDTEVKTQEKETVTKSAPEVKEDNPQKEEASNETAEAETNEKAESAGGVDPDLKAFLDSYEEFVDEYVAFMKKYQADPTNAVAMLGEYSEMMQKYADFADKVDKYDSDSMSVEDSKYYIEVTTRCTQKMLEVY